MKNLINILKLHSRHLVGLFCVLAGMVITIKWPMLGNPAIAFGVLLYGSGVKNKAELASAALAEAESIVHDLVDDPAPGPEGKSE